MLSYLAGLVVALTVIFGSAGLIYLCTQLWWGSAKYKERQSRKSSEQSDRDAAKVQQDYEDYLVLHPKTPVEPPFNPPRHHLQDLCKTLLSKFPGLVEPSVFIKPPEAFKDHVLPSKIRAHAIDSHTIEINENCLKTATEAELIDIMTHELLHCWIHAQGWKHTYHGKEFEVAAKLLNITFNPNWRAHDELELKAWELRTNRSRSELYSCNG